MLRFILANLVPSILAGALAWGMIKLLYRFLPLRDPRRRLALYGVPLLKSALVLLGLGLVLPWPALFASWRAAAVPWHTAIPCALLWAGGTLVLQDALRRSAYRDILSDAVPAREIVPGIDDVLAEVVALFRRPQKGRVPAPFRVDADRIPGDLPVLVSSRVTVPLALTHYGEEAVVLPAGLAGTLGADPLRSVLAHEVAHLVISRPFALSATWWSWLTPISPIALFLAEDIRREEERACDAMAARALGDPEGYAESLVKTFRLIRARGRTSLPGMSWVPQLTGRQPTITERVEALIKERSPLDVPWSQALVSYVVWGASWVFLF